MNWQDIRLLRPVTNAHVPTLFKFLGGVHAGFPSPAADYTEEEIDIKAFLMPHPSSTFIMKIEGDSMIRANIPPNSYVVIDRSVKPLNNSIIVAVINGEITCKRLVKKGRTLLLVAENPKYEPITITEEMGFLVWGTVTRVLIDATKL